MDFRFFRDSRVPPVYMQHYEIYMHCFSQCVFILIYAEPFLADMLQPAAKANLPTPSIPWMELSGCNPCGAKGGQCTHLYIHANYGGPDRMREHIHHEYQLNYGVGLFFCGFHSGQPSAWILLEQPLPQRVGAEGGDTQRAACQDQLGAGRPVLAVAEAAGCARATATCTAVAEAGSRR